MKSHVKPVAVEEESSHTCKGNGHQAKTRTVAPQSDATEVLNRDQTEEWKGWMQFMFLLYHYFHAEEVYNSIRIMITCYVWMTGFGNFSFFYIKGDYGSIRVMQMLWRLNFLVFFLCMTQGTTYILYYICLLHTYFFLMVYVTMRVGKHLNYSTFGIRFKLGGLAMLIFLIWDADFGLFRLLHYPFLGESPMLGATGGAMWEWYFRSSLDHWSTFLGMLFALNFPITSLFFRKLEAQPPLQHFAAKGIMAVAFVAAVYWWVLGPFSQEKFDYNQTNAYYGWIPMIAYIYLRNITPWLRGHTLELLHQIGKTTLETYLMQHHIWLTSDAKSLLTLIPGWPKVNFLLVSVLYVCASRRLYQLTLFLRGMVLPNDRGACLRNLTYLAASLVVSVILASVLSFLNLLDMATVALCCILCGGILYVYVLDSTDVGTSASSSAPTVGLSSSVFSTAGFVAVVAVGLCWHHMAETGAGKILPLRASCAARAIAGQWVPVNACSEDIRGQSYRDHSIGALGTCSPLSKSYVWGWEASPPASRCRLAPRDKKELLKTLKHRKLTFVGDSVMRHLYHATCRQLGDAAAGAYDTSKPKWSDFEATYDKTSVEFKWAPFVNDVTSALQSIQKQTEKPDVVVLGGGAWDRLYLDNDWADLESNVTKLVAKMAKTDISTAWVVPTTINTAALPAATGNKKNKQEHLTEEQMVKMRQIYEDKGVLRAASYTLDGTAFTKDRVSESYDGVHYPLEVYDAGAQILANAYDWLLPEKDTSDPFYPSMPGKMANPALGLMMLGFTIVALFLFDGFMGASYLAAIFVPSVMPVRLFVEGFSSLHHKLGLPAISGDSVFCSAGPNTDDGNVSGVSYKSKDSDHHDDADFEEHESFLGDSDKDERDVTVV